MEKTTQCIAGGGLLAAIAAVLQLVGSAIRFGPFSVSLVLIPIVLGAALYGWGMGCWLGLVFGAVVLLSGGCRPLSGGGSGRGHCDGAEQGHCLRRSGGPVLPVAAPTVSETFHSAVGSGRPADQYGGVSAGPPTVFHAPHPSVGAAGGLCQRRSYLMAGMVGCPCTLVFTGGLGRFVAPLCRREAVYDEDLLLRGLWKLCTANCPSADKPEKRSRYKRRLGTMSPQPPFFCPTTGRAGLTERTPAPPMRRR